MPFLARSCNTGNCAEQARAQAPSSNDHLGTAGMEVCIPSCATKDGLQPHKFRRHDVPQRLPRLLSSCASENPPPPPPPDPRYDHVHVTTCSWMRSWTGAFLTLSRQNKDTHILTSTHALVWCQSVQWRVNTMERLPTGVGQG